MTDGELTFGSLNFLSAPFSALAEGFDTGAPVPLVTAVPRLLLDGELITHERDSNRDLSFRLEVTGNDVLDLNEAEAELVREVNKPRNTLRWKPPGMNTPVTVFETFAGFVSQVFDDFEEMVHGKRVYTVTLPALPHARSETLRSASLAGRTEPVLLDSCDSLTNWSGRSGGPAPTLDTSVKMEGTGSLKVTGSVTIAPGGSGSGSNLGWKRTASFAAAAGLHVIGRIRSNYAPSGAPWLQVFTASETFNASVISATAGADGFTEYVWAVGNEDALTVTSLEVRPVVGPNTTVAGTYTINAWLDFLQTFTEAPPSDLAGLRLLDTGGSVRTPGTLRLSNDTDPLGDVLVATWADLGDGFRPDVARWYVTGGTETSDAGSVSGANYTTLAAFDIPNSSLAPGPYAVFAKPTTGLVPSSVTVTMQTQIGGAGVGPSVSVTGAVADEHITPLGMVHLPAATTPAASSGVTRLQVSLSGDGSKVDEVWLFRVDGQLTWLQDAPQYVFLESASPDLPYGGVWVGNESDESDAYNPGEGLRLAGRHVFEAPSAAVYVAATNAAPAVDLLHYRRWHSNAAD